MIPPAKLAGDPKRIDNLLRIQAERGTNAGRGPHYAENCRWN